MGDIMRRVVTLFEARGAEQIRASMGSMRTDFTNYRREVDQTSRTQGMLNNQMRALGTTLRYAFAGSAVYGVSTMVRELGQFQARLGEISSIATTTGGLPLVGRQLDQLGEDLIRVSTDTTQPIDDLEQGVISLYSTIGNIPPNEAADMMKTIAEVSITAQSNIEDTTQALLGMVDAFGANTKELPRFGNEFYKVIKLSAGMPGHIYAQQLGRLSASATLSGFSPEEMGALAIGATRSGGSSATNMRGLAQLMTFIMNPTSPKTQKAFAAVGLGKAQRNQLGAWGTLQRVLTLVNQRGLAGRPGAITDDQVNAITDIYGQDNAPNKAIGISGAGGDLLAQLFPRIEGRRIAAVLAKIQNPSQVAGTPNQTLDQYLGQVKDQTDELDGAMARAMDRRRIQQAGNAVHNLGIEIGTAFSPLLQIPAKGITSLTNAFGNQDPNVRLAEVVGGGVGLAALLRRFGTSGAVRGGVGGLAAIDAITQGPGGARGSSPLNPLYVLMVGQLFGRTGGLGIPSRDMRTAESELGGPGYVGKGIRGGVKPTRFGRAAKVGGGVIGGVLAAYGIDTAINSWMQTRGMSPSAQDAAATAGAQGHPLLKYLGIGHYNALGQPSYSHKGTGAEHDIIDQYSNKKISADQAEAMLRKLATSDQLKAAGITMTGKANLDVNITQQDSTGAVTHRKKAKVTLDLFPGFTQPAPQTKAKSKSHRGGN